MQKQKIDRRLAEGNHIFFSTEASIQQLSEREMDISMVYFKQGMRTKPHTHAHDQVLSIHEGRGIVATEQEKLDGEAGDVITIPAGVWHWHEARHDSAMAHMAITISGLSDWNVEEKHWKTSYAE